MGKSLYSLLLSDEVVEGIDRIALRNGISRSALVDRILAEYASVQTPQMRINNIFRQMEQLMDAAGGIVPMFSEGQQSMVMKSSLQYKYRPTVKYAVSLYDHIDEAGRIGELAVNFRTQSQALLSEIGRFFEVLSLLEAGSEKGRFADGAVRRTLEDGKFTRTLAIPRDTAYTADQLGELISDYVRKFDALMNGWLSSGGSTQALSESFSRMFPDGINI